MDSSLRQEPVLPYLVMYSTLYLCTVYRGEPCGQLLAARTSSAVPSHVHCTCVQCTDCNLPYVLAIIYQTCLSSWWCYCHPTLVTPKGEYSMHCTLFSTLSYTTLNSPQPPCYISHLHTGVEQFPAVISCSCSFSCTFSCCAGATSRFFSTVFDVFRRFFALKLGVFAAFDAENSKKAKNYFLFVKLRRTTPATVSQFSHNCFNS